MVEAVDRLTAAADERERARERVEAVGEDRLRRCREAHDDLAGLLDEYEDRATGSGDFEAFIEFQGRVATLAEELPEDLPERDTFEEIDEFLQQRRLTEDDFATARRKLDAIAETTARLDDWERAREQFREAGRAARKRLDAVADRIDECERLQRLGEADLDAPVERLREPIAAYDDAVSAAFDSYRGDAPAREVLETVARADAYPLVGYRSPPPELLAYVREHEPGTEPIPRLLEYADYSRSKLDHYVADPDALKRAVATRQTYLRRLDAEPVTVGWPPPPAAELPWRCRAYRSVADRFADESVVAKLRRVRRLARREDYERLRESALARAELSERERERLASGAVADELDDLRAEREAIEAALDEYD